MYAWFHYFGDFYTCQHPGDTSRYYYYFYFSRRSALVRPSERGSFFFQECYVHVVYQMTPRDLFIFRAVQPSYGHRNHSHFFSGVLRTPCLDAFCRSVFFFPTRFRSVPTSRKATNFSLTSGLMHVRQLLDRHTTLAVTRVLCAQVSFSPA